MNRWARGFVLFIVFWAVLAAHEARSADMETLVVKVLTEPKRFFQADDQQPQTLGFVGLEFDVADDAEYANLSTPDWSFTVNVAYFCKNRCRRLDGCRWDCRIGLYYVWPEGQFDNWSPRISVQASNGGSFGDPRPEADVSCEDGAGRGCPCWLFPRADPSSSCDVRPSAVDGLLDFSQDEPVPMLLGPGRSIPQH